MSAPMQEMSPAREDVVKLIFALSAEGHAVTNKLLVEALRVSAPSVSVMVKRLGDEQLVTRSSERGIALTERGDTVALSVIRRHRLLETFLVQSLGLSWDEVHEEADLLEHAISDRLTERIDASLGHPRHDPHGDPIPSAERPHDERRGIALHDVPVGSRLRVDRVRDDDPQALRHLAAIGAVPGAVIDVDERGPYGEPLWVRVDGRAHVLGTILAGQVHGSVLPACAVTPAEDPR